MLKAGFPRTMLSTASDRFRPDERVTLVARVIAFFAVTLLLCRARSRFNSAVLYLRQFITFDFYQKKIVELKERNRYKSKVMVIRLQEAFSPSHLARGKQVRCLDPTKVFPFSQLNVQTVSTGSSLAEELYEMPKSA